MKIIAQCMKCFEDSRIDGQLPIIEHSYIELNDENIYEYTCSKGHRTVTALQQQRFELLVDISVWAFGLGFPDLAAIRAYSALEVFESFFIECAAYNSDHSNLEVTAILKNVKLSERRRGAFLFSFASLSKTHPLVAPNLPNFKKLTEIRNKVVHEGMFISIEKSRQYCEEIFDFIVDTINWMRRHMDLSINKCISAHIKKNLANNTDTCFYFMAIPTIISLSLAELNKTSIDQAFQKLLESKMFVKPEIQ